MRRAVGTRQAFTLVLALLLAWPGDPASRSVEPRRGDSGCPRDAGCGDLGPTSRITRPGTRVEQSAAVSVYDDSDEEEGDGLPLPTGPAPYVVVSVQTPHAPTAESLAATSRGARRTIVRLCRLRC